VPTGWGTEVEDYARRLAGGFGVVDFVYEPIIEERGSGSREISDGLLICGEDGLIMQVKSRQPEQASHDTPERAESWLRRHASEGADQAAGTRRRLTSGGSTTFRSLRGYERTLDSVRPWPAVVILEHPAAPPNVQIEQRESTLFLTLGDWYALNERLRSTAAVIQYVERTLAVKPHPPLGGEQLRYDALAQADATAIGGAYPLLPARSLDEDARIHAAFVEDLIEKVWAQDGELSWQDPDEYRLIVEVLDRVLPAARATLGNRMLRTFLVSVQTHGRRSFLVKDQFQNAVFAFVYDVVRNASAKIHRAQVVALTSVRHQQALETGAGTDLKTLGVGILHDDALGRQYTFVLARGQLDVSAEVTMKINDEFGLFDGSGVG
jgi:hypothetical protein